MTVGSKKDDGSPKKAAESRDPAYEKLAISLPRPLAQAAREEVRAGRAPSLSALVAEALAEKLEQDRLQEALDEVFHEEPMTDEEREWADKLLAC